MTNTWRTWLIAWCWVTLAIGAMFAIIVVPPLSAPAQLFLDVVFWPIDGQPAATARETVFAVAVIGAVMIGWGVLMLGLVHDSALSREPRVWGLMTTALLVWFVVDSLVSWLAGATLNVLGNIAFVASWLLPIMASGVLGQRTAASH